VPPQDPSHILYCPLGSSPLGDAGPGRPTDPPRRAELFTVDHARRPRRSPTASPATRSAARARLSLLTRVRLLPQRGRTPACDPSPSAAGTSRQGARPRASLPDPADRPNGGGLCRKRVLGMCGVRCPTLFYRRDRGPPHRFRWRGHVYSACEPGAARPGGFGHVYSACEPSRTSPCDKNIS